MEESIFLASSNGNVISGLTNSSIKYGTGYLASAYFSDIPGMLCLMGGMSVIAVPNKNESK